MIQAISNLNINIKQQGKRPVNGLFSVSDTLLPAGERNYCLFNQNKINFIVSQKELALPQLKEVLQTSQDEKEIVEALYIVDRLADIGTKGIPAMYPLLAKFNDTKSPNIQVYLAGIYRKTQVPDAFGPLVSMLVKNSIKKSDDAKINVVGLENPTYLAPFDANEEIGGAILEYIRNYSNKPKQIDYTA